MDSDYNVIANYKYDAYGKVVSITDNEKKEITDTNHIAYINPFRYRSYYYDEETKLYYLNSRYYNPLFGRFINADNYVSTDSGYLGYNMYTYCNNNINYVDETGHWITLGLMAGIAIVGTIIIGNTIYRGHKAQKEIEKVQKKPNVSRKENQNFQNTLKNNASTVKKETKNMNVTQKLDYFISNVKSGGQYDLKRKAEWQRDIYFDNHIMEPQDIGNYHFGYIGRAMGYDTTFLTTGGGAYQFYEHYREPITYANCLSFYTCDDPRDNYYIRLGAIAYDRDN